MFVALFVTIVAGIFFGLSLCITEKVLFKSSKVVYMSLFSQARLAILALFFYIILKSNQIHPIILITLFLGTYWLTILVGKELLHARS